MENVFQYLDYRKLLSDQAQTWKKRQVGRTLQEMAEKTQLQASYLTNALKGRVHLNADQVYSLGALMEWEVSEIEYAILLQDWERCGRAARRDFLKKRIDEIRETKMQVRHNLKKEVIDTSTTEFTKFYLNPFYVMINSMLGVKRFAKTPLKMASCLGLSPGQVQKWLKDLVNMGFLSLEKSVYVKTKRNFHLPRESPLFEPHTSLMQQTVSMHLQNLPSEEKQSVNVRFSADPATREKIHREFMAFLKKTEELVKDAPNEELYGLRFDLYRWSYEKE